MIIKFIVRVGLLILYTILAIIYKNKLLHLDFYYYIPIYLYFLYLALKNFIPTKKILPTHRYCKGHYKKTTFNGNALAKQVKKDNAGAVTILCIWLFGLTILGALYFLGCFKTIHLIWFVFLFNVLDLVCLYYWCPFKIILKNKCCMDCRITNYDSFFRFSPFIFILTPFTSSLAILGILSLALWEIKYFTHREYFYSQSNPLNCCTHCQNECCSKNRIKDMDKNTK